MEHTAQVMGIAGAGRGTGVTHFVIQAANYLCSCRQKKTAILQWNPQKDLEKIRAFLGAGGKEDSRSFKKKDHFRLLGVDYYYEGDPAVLAACMEKDYQEILIDFGKVREEIFPEWLRCTKKVLVADLSEWKLEAFLGLLTEKGEAAKEWICMTAFGGEIMKQEIERQFHISLKQIPLSADPFSVDVPTMEWFADIFK